MRRESYKNLMELSKDDLKRVWENNKGVRERVFDWGMDLAYFTVENWLHGLPRGTAKYSIGGQGDYFKVENVESFLFWLKNAQMDFCLLPENDEFDPWPMMEKVGTIHERMTRLEYELSDENYNRMETRRDEILEELAKEVQKVFSGEYEYFYSEKNCFSAFVENIELIFGEEYWVDESCIVWRIYTREECLA